MMQRLTKRRDYNCACWNGNQDFTTHKRYLEMLEALCAYEDLNRTPEQLGSDLADLAAYRKKGPVEELERVVRCGGCVHWRDRQIQMQDGTCRDYGPDDEVYVDITKGINVSPHCMLHGLEDSSGSWFWANKSDFCSRGERKQP